MTPRHAAPSSSAPGETLVRIGAVVFVLGVVAVVVAVVPSVLSGDPARLSLILAAGTLLPVGLGVALVGLLRAARTGRRTAAAGPARPAGSSTPT